jgi:predicted metal-dependent phosphoesterase TrpH
MEALWTTTQEFPGAVPNAAHEPGGLLRMADLHLHSHYSHDVVNIPELSPRALYEKAVARGMGFFTLTDHDHMNGIEALRRELTAAYGSDWPIPVIPGAEITLRDPRIGHTIHVNVLGLERPQLRELGRRRRDLDRFLDFCREQDLYHAYNHPFWFEDGERGDPAVIRSLCAEFPVIELNAGRIPQLNERTLELARSLGRHVVATSDSHTGNIGRAVTLAPGDTPHEFLRNIRDGVSAALPHHTTFRAFVHELEQAIELVVGGATPLRLKHSFLRDMPRLRRVTQSALGSDRLMQNRILNWTVCSALKVLACPHAYFFVHRQVRMHRWLAEVEA